MEYGILIIFKNLYTPHSKEDQMNNSMGSSPIFYENGSWYHRTKSLSENLQIEYGKKEDIRQKMKQLRHMLST